VPWPAGATEPAGPTGAPGSVADEVGAWVGGRNAGTDPPWALEDLVRGWLAAGAEAGPPAVTAAAEANELAIAAVATRAVPATPAVTPRTTRVARSRRRMAERDIGDLPIHESFLPSAPEGSDSTRRSGEVPRSAQSGAARLGSREYLEHIPGRRPHMATRDTGDQQHRAKSTSDEVHDESQETSDLAERKEALDEDVDSLLDEIDDVLEENAEAFVRGFVQKGGQ